MKHDEILPEIVELGNTINSKAFNLTRCMLLAIISYFKDGIQFRELKSALNLSDGKLFSNLHFLIEMNMIKSKKTRLDNKEIEYYMIADRGENELEKIVKWNYLIGKLLGIKNE